MDKCIIQLHNLMLSSDREMIFNVKDQSANQPKPSVMTFGFLEIHIFSEFMELAQVTRSELHYE